MVMNGWMDDVCVYVRNQSFWLLMHDLITNLYVHFVSGQAFSPILNDTCIFLYVALLQSARDHGIISIIVTPACVRPSVPACLRSRELLRGGPSLMFAACCSCAAMLEKRRVAGRC